MQLPVKALEFRKSLVGIESRISEIKEMMDRKLDGVLFIGLWGMGGIGKTTLARAIFEDCKDEFEGSCFLQDVKENKNLQKLQKKLLSNVLKTEFKEICDVFEGSSFIQERLQFKKVVIVIDDVDNREQLNALAKGYDWFGKGSIIIITTRDEHLINDIHIEKYQVDLLRDNEALHLFCLHAFKSDHPDEGFEELSVKFVSYAGGLPLAHRVLGDHLYLQKSYFWESALRRLKDDPQKDIRTKLEISFDGLSVLQQNIFLDIACIFRGRSKYKVEDALECLGLHPKEGIDVLIQKSLIYIRIDHYVGRDKYCVETHDLLQDMGWYIVRQRSSENVREYSRLWLGKDIVELVSDVTLSSEAERIRIHSDPFPDDDMIKSNLGWEVTFKNMNKLSFLQLEGDIFKGNYDVNVSQPFSQHGYKLRWFTWFEYPGHSLPKGFRGRNLVHLCMKYSLLKETPDFSLMPNLEILDLRRSIVLEYVHPSLGNHMKIKRIDLGHCEKLKEFPKIKRMKSLEILDLSDTRLHQFPEIDRELDSFRKLRVTNVGYVPIVLGFASFEVLPVSFPGLVWLEISGTSIEKTLDFSRLPNLEKLDLSHSSKLVQVDASLGVHKRIKSINLSYCSKLEEFPTIESMDSLEELNLSNTILQSFPEMRGNVNRLVKLDLDGTEIRTLPQSIEHATSLEHILFRECEILEELPGCLLSRIELLYIENCPILSGWICVNLVNLLVTYKQLCFVELHQRSRGADRQKILQAFSEWELMYDMLQRREKAFKVCISRRPIPSWFQYQFSTPCVSVFLPPLSEWYTDNLRGFLISGINVELKNIAVMPTHNDLADLDDCRCPGSLHVVVMYIPIDDIMRDIEDGDTQNPCTLLELNSSTNIFSGGNSPRWGLSLVYSEGEVNEIDPHQVMIITDDDFPNSCEGTFRVKLAESRDTMEKLNNPIPFALFQLESYFAGFLM